MMDIRISDVSQERVCLCARVRACACAYSRGDLSFRPH
jgi:hypothetical protein